MKTDNDNYHFPEKLNTKSYGFNLYLCILGKTRYFYAATCRKSLLKILAINFINPDKLFIFLRKMVVFTTFSKAIEYGSKTAFKFFNTLLVFTSMFPSIISPVLGSIGSYPDANNKFPTFKAGE